MLSITLLALPEQKGFETLHWDCLSEPLQNSSLEALSNSNLFFFFFLPFLRVDLTFGMSQKVAQNRSANQMNDQPGFKLRCRICARFSNENNECSLLG